MGHVLAGGAALVILRIAFTFVHRKWGPAGVLSLIGCQCAAIGLLATIIR